MEQLLSITTIPLKYELSITHARLEHKAQDSQVQITRQEGSFNIKNKPAQLLINTLDARNSMTPTAFLSIEQAAQKGLQAAQNATAQYAMEGKQFIDAMPGDDPLGNIIAQRSAPSTGEFQLAFIPKVGPEIQYKEPDFQMRYQADRLQFDVRVSKGDLEYVPGNIDMNITQWPDVMIEYIGRPVYVPPSSAERFEASA